MRTRQLQACRMHRIDSIRADWLRYCHGLVLAWLTVTLPFTAVRGHKSTHSRTEKPLKPLTHLARRREDPPAQTTLLASQIRLLR